MQYAIPCTILMLLATSASAGDWLTLPSTYTHGGQGGRVTQYAAIPAPSAPTVSNFRSSGYTHTRSSLAYGQSADNYHRVETWGDPVRPYGEWRFPYRPFSTPYPNWGAPYAGLNVGLWGGVYPGVGYGAGNGPGGHRPGRPGHPGGGTLPPNPGAPGNPNLPPRRPSRYDPINPDGIFREPRVPNTRPSDPNLFRPYPAGPGSPYPVAPYYDGYYPNYRQ